jgi:hypothetical protein
MRCSSSEPSLNMVTPCKSITQCEASRLWHRVWECQKGNHVSSTVVDGCFKVGSEVLMGEQSCLALLFWLEENIVRGFPPIFKIEGEVICL